MFKRRKRILLTISIVLINFRRFHSVLVENIDEFIPQCADVLPNLHDVIFSYPKVVTLSLFIANVSANQKLHYVVMPHPCFVSGSFLKKYEIFEVIALRFKSNKFTITLFLRFALVPNRSIFTVGNKLNGGGSVDPSSK